MRGDYREPQPQVGRAGHDERGRDRVTHEQRDKLVADAVELVLDDVAKAVELVVKGSPQDV